MHFPFVRLHGSCIVDRLIMTFGLDLSAESAVFLSL